MRHIWMDHSSARFYLAYRITNLFLTGVWATIATVMVIFISRSIPPLCMVIFCQKIRTDMAKMFGYGKTAVPPIQQQNKAVSGTLRQCSEVAWIFLQDSILECAGYFLCALTHSVLFRCFAIFAGNIGLNIPGSLFEPSGPQLCTPTSADKFHTYTRFRCLSERHILPNLTTKREV